MWLGIDLGTSGVKTIVMDDGGAVVARESVPLGIERPHPGWSEQDPDEWWRAVRQSIRALPGMIRARMKGVALSGQMHGAVVLGDKDRPLRPAILWNDTRSAAEARSLSEQAKTHAGNLAMPGFTAPKLLWMAQHEPDIISRIKTVLLPKDYIRLRLTGERASEMSDASGTLWLDIARRQWSEPMLDACGMTIGQMPRLVEGTDVSGQLLASVAEDLGLPIVPVAGGAGDQAAGAIGVGVIESSNALLSLGTSGVIFAPTNAFTPAPDNGVHAFCHALPDRWHVMSVMLSSAACLDWAARLAGFKDVPFALSAAEKSTDASHRPLFLPYLSGERTPHNDASARGVFFGLDNDTDGASLVHSVLEGVAFGLRDGLDALQLDLAELSVIGGGARSALCSQIICDALQVPLVVRDGAEVGPALGAARLAQIAAIGAAADEVCTKPPVLARYEPGDEPISRLATFRKLYRSIKSLFEELT